MNDMVPLLGSSSLCESARKTFEINVEMRLKSLEFNKDTR